MTVDLTDKAVAMLATDGFEESELCGPREMLRERRATVDIVAPGSRSIRGWHDSDWGDAIEVDVRLADADPGSYHAPVLPGGVLNSDALRRSTEAMAFAHACAGRCIPMAAICHGPQLLIECNLVRGHRVTSAPAIRTDLENAGASWIDQEVVTDRLLITSRGPGDLEAFNAAIVVEIAKGMSADQTAG